MEHIELNNEKCINNVTDREDEKILIESLIRTSNRLIAAIRAGRFTDAGISETYDIFCCFRGIIQDEYHDKIFCHCRRLTHNCEGKCLNGNGGV